MDAEQDEVRTVLLAKEANTPAAATVVARHIPNTTDNEDIINEVSVKSISLSTHSLSLSLSLSLTHTLSLFSLPLSLSLLFSLSF